MTPLAAMTPLATMTRLATMTPLANMTPLAAACPRPAPVTSGPDRSRASQQTAQDVLRHAYASARGRGSRDDQFVTAPLAW